MNSKKSAFKTAIWTTFIMLVQQIYIAILIHVKTNSICSVNGPSRLKTQHAAKYANTQN